MKTVVSGEYVGGRRVSLLSQKRLKKRPPSYGRLKDGPVGKDSSNLNLDVVIIDFVRGW